MLSGRLQLSYIVAKRRGVATDTLTSEMEEFEDFIDDMGLVNIPLIGRKFTWHRANGTSMSRLERLLLSEDWLAQWEDLSQWGLQRTISDHCPILLKSTSINWGPKPFRVLNCWLMNSEFLKFVSDSWSKVSVAGSGSYILK